MNSFQRQVLSTDTFSRSSKGRALGPPRGNGLCRGRSDDRRVATAAYPSQYQVTGVKTFLIGYDGVLYEKDLGPTTSDIASSIVVYNPDKTWKRTNVEQ